MRPSTKSGEIAILDTRAEGEVLLDYLKSVDYLRELPGFSEAMRTGFAYGKEVNNPLGQRFFYQATVFDETTHKTVVAEDIEFPLSDGEGDIATAAAQRVLNCRNPFRRITDQKSGCTKAAQDIVNLLTNS